MVALSTAVLERLWERVSCVRREEDEGESSRDGGRVQIEEEIGDRPWVYRQFSVLNPDGNRITFFRFLEGGNPSDDVERDAA
jgi:hypothetical protein